MKLTRLVTISTLLLLQFAFFSCQKEEDVLPVENIVPLQVGNEWHYQVTDYDTDGEVIATSTFSRTVLKDTLIHGRTWYILSDGRIVRNSQEGYVYFHKEANEAYITYPSTSQANIGYGYEYPTYLLWVLTTRTFDLVPVQGTIENFNCYVFSIERQMSQASSSSISSTWIKDYVSPEVGLVRSDRYYADSDKIFRRYELVRFWVQ